MRTNRWILCNYIVVVTQECTIFSSFSFVMIYSSVGILKLKNSLNVMWTAMKSSIRGDDRRIQQKDKDFRLVLLQILISNPEF